MKKSVKDRKGKKNYTKIEEGSQPGKGKEKPRKEQDHDQYEHEKAYENETANTIQTSYNFQIDIESIFVTSSPIILDYQTMATSLPPKTTQSVLDQVLSLPPQIIFEYTPWGQNSFGIKDSLLINAVYHPPHLKIAQEKLSNICRILEITKSGNVPDDFPYQFLPYFSDYFFTMEQITITHQNLLKRMESFTKMGLICLVSGGLRLHLEALENFMVLWRKTMNQLEMDQSLSTFFHFAKTIELILFNSQVIIRAMKHVESICILGKTKQIDENPAFRYFIETFILSCPIRGKFSSYHLQLYSLLPDAIRFHLLIDIQQSNHYHYFQYFCKIHHHRNPEFLSEFNYYYTHIHEESPPPPPPPATMILENNSYHHRHVHHSLGKFLLHFYFPICFALCHYPLESLKLFHKLSEVLMIIKEKEVFSIDSLNMAMNISGKYEKGNPHHHHNQQNTSPSSSVLNNPVLPYVSYLFQFQRYLTILMKYAVTIVILKYLQQWPTGDDEQSLNDAKRRYQLGRDFIDETIRKKLEEQEQQHLQQSSFSNRKEHHHILPMNTNYLSLVACNNAFFEFMKCHEIFQIGGFFTRLLSHEYLTTSQLQQLTKWKNIMEKDLNKFEENVKCISIQQLFQFLELNYQEFRNHFQ